MVDLAGEESPAGPNATKVPAAGPTASTVPCSSLRPVFETILPEPTIYEVFDGGKPLPVEMIEEQDEDQGHGYYELFSGDSGIPIGFSRDGRTGSYYFEVIEDGDPSPVAIVDTQRQPLVLADFDPDGSSYYEVFDIEGDIPTSYSPDYESEPGHGPPAMSDLDEATPRRHDEDICREPTIYEVFEGDGPAPVAIIEEVDGGSGDGYYEFFSGDTSFPVEFGPDGSSQSPYYFEILEDDGPIPIAIVDAQHRPLSGAITAEEPNGKSYFEVFEGDSPVPTRFSPAKSGGNDSDASGYLESDPIAFSPPKSGTRDSDTSGYFEGPIAFSPDTVEKEPAIYEVFEGSAAPPIEIIEEVEEGQGDGYCELFSGDLSQPIGFIGSALGSSSYYFEVLEDGDPNPVSVIGAQHRPLVREHCLSGPGYYEEFEMGSRVPVSCSPDEQSGGYVKVLDGGSPTPLLVVEPDGDPLALGSSSGGLPLCGTDGYYEVAASAGESAVVEPALYEVFEGDGPRPVEIIEEVEEGWGDGYWEEFRGDDVLPAEFAADEKKSSSTYYFEIIQDGDPDPVTVVDAQHRTLTGPTIGDASVRYFELFDGDSHAPSGYEEDGMAPAGDVVHETAPWGYYEVFDGSDFVHVSDPGEILITR
jgi:hypothetical protein